MGLHREAPNTNQVGGFKEQVRGVQETARQAEAGKSKDFMVGKRVADADTQRKWEQEAKVESRREIARKAEEARMAKAEAEREVARKAELEEKGLPYYPLPKKSEKGHTAEEWYRLLQDNPLNARIYEQAIAALSALREEGIPFLLDHLSHETTPKSRHTILQLIQVKCIHPNDLQRLLPCLERSKNYPATRLLALEGLEKRAKDISKQLVPKIESLVQDMLDNPRNSEETKEEVRSRLKTIRLDANPQSVNRLR